MTVFHNVLLRLNSFSSAKNIRLQLVNRISTSSVLNYSPKQTLEEKLGIKPKPKRPHPPFLRYIIQTRPLITQQHPQASPTEVIKILSDQWKSVENSVKDKFQQDYQKDKEKYQEDLKEYEKLLSPVDREELAKAKEEIKTEKEKKALKKKKEELGCPKKPASSYVYFMRTKLPERGETSFIEFQKKVKTDWDTLPSTEKNRFEKLYKVDMEAYRTKMDQWTAQMKEQGLDFSSGKSGPKMGKPKDEPKKPGGAFTYFQKSKLIERGDMPMSDFQKKIGKEWEQLPQNERQKYDNMHRKDMEAYKLKMDAWSKSRESKSKPGETLELVSPLRPDFSSDSIQIQNVNKNVAVPMPTKDQESLQKIEDKLPAPGPPKSQNFVSREIIVSSVLISTTLIVVFSIYLIVFY